MLERLKASWVEEGEKFDCITEEDGSPEVMLYLEIRKIKIIINEKVDRNGHNE